MGLLAFVVWTLMLLVVGYACGYIDGDVERRRIERRGPHSRAEWERRFWEAYEHLQAIR